MYVIIKSENISEEAQLMEELINYYHFDRDQWRQFYSNDRIEISQNSLNQIKAFSDRISVRDVDEVYLPLTKLIKLRYQQYLNWQEEKTDFLHLPQKRVPFILGIAGSVAVGKSTSARLLAKLLEKFLPDAKVDLITTDGFLYPNQVLKDKEIMNRKGFPESYDMEKLLTFLNDLKAGVDSVQLPVYSHQIYDIVPDEMQTLEKPDVLIVEGINTLQLPSNELLYISDFFDFSLYVDADPRLIEQWFLERFGMLLDSAFKDPTNYYYSLAIGDRNVAFEHAKKIWREIDYTNLREFILPTRNRADVILHKTKHHQIDDIYLRK